MHWWKHLKMWQCGIMLYTVFATWVFLLNCVYKGHMCCWGYQQHLCLWCVTVLSMTGPQFFSIYGKWKKTKGSALDVLSLCLRNHRQHRPGGWEWSPSSWYLKALSVQDAAEHIRRDVYVGYCWLRAFLDGWVVLRYAVSLLSCWPTGKA